MKNCMVNLQSSTRVISQTTTKSYFKLLSEKEVLKHFIFIFKEKAIFENCPMV